MPEIPGSDSPDRVVPILKIVGVDEAGEHHDILRIDGHISTVNDSVRSAVNDRPRSSTGWTREYGNNFDNIFGAKHSAN